MLALKIIGGVLLFLLALTLLPLRMELGFQTEFSLTLRYLFLSFRLLPGKRAGRGKAGGTEKRNGKEIRLEKKLKAPGLFRIFGNIV